MNLICGSYKIIAPVVIAIIDHTLLLRLREIVSVPFRSSSLTLRSSYSCFCSMGEQVEAPLMK